MRKAAASVSIICPNADAQGIQEIFLALFPSSGCRPMAAEFADAYQELSAAAVAAVAAA